MIGFIIFLFGIITTLGMCILAAKSDMRGYKIPNIYSVIIIAAFVIVYGVLTITEQSENVFRPIGNHMGAAFLVFVVTGALFALKQLGAGDSKFATAVALWVGLKGLVPFLFYMALVGGVMGIIALILRHKKPFSNVTAGGWIDTAQQGGGSLPYGVAIAAGTFIAFIMVGYLSPATWEKFF